MSKAWTILVKYTTGDSFGSEKTEDTLGIVWRDLDKAKEGLRVLKAHYKACNDIRAARYQNHENKIRTKLMDEYWFGKSEVGYSHEYNINMLTDTNDLMGVYAFWMGYFETIHSAHIVVYVEDEQDENADDMNAYF